MTQINPLPPPPGLCERRQGLRTPVWKLWPKKSETGHQHTLLSKARGSTLYCLCWRVSPDSSTDVSPALRASRGRKKAEIFLLSLPRSSGHCPPSGSFPEPTVWAHKLQDWRESCAGSRGFLLPLQSPSNEASRGPEKCGSFLSLMVCVSPDSPSTPAPRDGAGRRGLREAIRLRWGLEDAARMMWRWRREPAVSAEGAHSEGVATDSPGGRPPQERKERCFSRLEIRARCLSFTVCAICYGSLGWLRRSQCFSLNFSGELSDECRSPPYITWDLGWGDVSQMAGTRVHPKLSETGYASESLV